MIIPAEWISSSLAILILGIDSSLSRVDYIPVDCPRLTNYLVLGSLFQAFRISRHMLSSVRVIALD